MKLLRISQIIRQFLTSRGYSLASYPNFPYSEYMALSEYYDQCLKWYTGEALEEMTAVDGVKVPKFPVKINPLPATCLKHAMALLGEIKDDARPPIIPKLVPQSKSKADETVRESIQQAEEKLNVAWWESAGRSILMQNSLISQYMGGSVLGIRFVPWEVELGWRTIPFRIVREEPQYFYPIPIAGDQFRLQEAWIVKPITWITAQTYGVKVSKDEPCYWIEHWTIKDYKITINDKPITPPPGENWKSEDTHEWGHVPWVYIPHIRDTEFFGESHVPTLAGLIEEINLRTADYGDAVSADSHNFPIMSGVQGDPKIRKIMKDMLVIDLGTGNVFTGNNAVEPKMYELHKPAASAAMREMIETLQKQYARDAFTPAVTDGEDEGSQRSGETINLRFWPLIAHTQAERTNWTDGLNWFTIMLLRMMKQAAVEGITEEHVQMRVRQEWASILPKSREALINEVVNRSSNDLGSPQHLIEMLGDVEDVEEELEYIREWLDEKAELKKKERPEPAFGANGMPPKGNGMPQKGAPNSTGATGATRQTESKSSSPSSNSSNRE